MIEIKNTPIKIRVVNCDSTDTILDAWKTSRPNAIINKDTLKEILKMDLPVNEMVHLTLDCKVPVLVREIITTLREHIMWARTSRVDNIVDSWEIYSRACEDDDIRLKIVNLADQMEIAMKNGESQDQYRRFLPLSYMTEFTFKVSLRTLGKLLRHMYYLSKKYDELKYILGDFSYALERGLEDFVVKNDDKDIDVVEIYNYLHNASINGKHINYNEFTPFSENSVTSSGGFIIMNVKKLPIGLRAQLVRSRTMMISDNLIEAFIEQGGWSADNTTTINMSICSSKQFFLNMCSQRECWLAQRDLWSPILDLIHLYLGDEVILPCHGGKCPVHQDCIQRLIGSDPGVVCPMNYILHKEETIPSKVLDNSEIEKIQKYANDTKRCKSLVNAANSLKDVITKFKGE